MVPVEAMLLAFSASPGSLISRRSSMPDMSVPLHVTRYRGIVATPVAFA